MMKRLGLAVALAALGCRDRAPPPEVARPPALAPAAIDGELAALAAFEDQRRAATDFATLPPSDRALGPDPYRIAALPDGRFVGLLHNDAQLVVLDARGTELARAATPGSPSDLAVTRAGDVLVVGEAARTIARYRVANGIVRAPDIGVDAIGLRGIALSPDERTAYVVEDHDGRLLAVDLAGGAAREQARCHGPVHVQAIGDTVAVDCVLDHAIELHRAGATTRIHHDGPMWGFAAHRQRDGALLIATGGVENHPLVRADGGFGYIDSFVSLYRAAPGAEPVELAAINVSELGVVTPKWLAIDVDAHGALAITTAGYATPGTLTLRWNNGDPASPPSIARGAMPPGTAAAVHTRDGAILAANPLLDAWIVARGDDVHIAPAPSSTPARSVLSRVGERLFFTTMMAPWNSSTGELSRFTCETCHHEGYVDGRVHFTGRDDVHAATRPLLGLFNNRPHFSRALDRTTSQMVHAEFRVANRHNGRDPWFALAADAAPWLAGIADAPATLSPTWLREAFMAFLLDFSHRANPVANDPARPRQFTPLEQRGATVFRDRCARCHAARLVADDPRTLVPFERWESLVLSPSGPIVWSDAAYAITGVVPLVHPSGARAPSLRRLYKKWPYFTNGSARSLDAVLEAFVDDATRAYHAASPADASLHPLSPDDRGALRAFLDLL